MVVNAPVVSIEIFVPATKLPPILPLIVLAFSVKTFAVSEMLILSDAISTLAISGHNK